MPQSSEGDQRNEWQEQQERHRKERGEGYGDIAPRHDEIALGEIYGTRRVDDEDEPQRDQSIGSAQCHAVQDKLQERHLSLFQDELVS
jgi:hypothetical protein